MRVSVIVCCLISVKRDKGKYVVLVEVVECAGGPDRKGGKDRNRLIDWDKICQVRNVRCCLRC